VPAAAVIPALPVHRTSAAVKKLVVEDQSRAGEVFHISTRPRPRVRGSDAPY
jgi:hypothetical protein